MLHEDEAGDAITGLQQKTHYGRPQWSQIFESISKAHPKYVTINSIQCVTIDNLTIYVHIITKCINRYVGSYVMNVLICNCKRIQTTFQLRIDKVMFLMWLQIIVIAACETTSETWDVRT